MPLIIAQCVEKKIISTTHSKTFITFTGAEIKTISDLRGDFRHSLDLFAHYPDLHPHLLCLRREEPATINTSKCATMHGCSRSLYCLGMTLPVQTRCSDQRFAVSGNDFTTQYSNFVASVTPISSLKSIKSKSYFFFLCSTSTPFGCRARVRD